MMNGNGSRPRAINFYFGVAKYLLFAMPPMAGVLILAAYLSDTYLRNGDCSFTESTFGFLGNAVRWYAGVLIVVLIAIHRVIFRQEPPPGDG